jgi:hypothetical protein
MHDPEPLIFHGESAQIDGSRVRPMAVPEEALFVSKIGLNALLNDIVTGH